MVFRLSTTPHFFYHGSCNISYANVDGILSEWLETIELSEAQSNRGAVTFENIESIDAGAVVKIRMFLRKYNVTRFALDYLQGAVADAILEGVVIMLGGPTHIEIRGCNFLQPELSLSSLFHTTFMTLDKLYIENVTIPGMVLQEWFSLPLGLVLSTLSFMDIHISGDEEMLQLDQMQQLTGSLMRVEIRSVSCDNPANVDFIFDALTGLRFLVELQLEDIEMRDSHAHRLVDHARFRNTLEILYVTQCGYAMNEDDAIQFFTALKDYYIEG